MPFPVACRTRPGIKPVSIGIMREEQERRAREAADSLKDFATFESLNDVIQQVRAATELPTGLPTELRTQLSEARIATIMRLQIALLHLQGIQLEEASAPAAVAPGTVPTLGRTSETPADDMCDDVYGSNPGGSEEPLWDGQSGNGSVPTTNISLDESDHAWKDHLQRREDAGLSDNGEWLRKCKSAKKNGMATRTEGRRTTRGERTWKYTCDKVGVTAVYLQADSKKLISAWPTNARIVAQVQGRSTFNERPDNPTLADFLPSFGHPGKMTRRFRSPSV